MRIVKIILIFIIAICLIESNVHAKEIFDIGKEWIDLGEKEAQDPGLQFGTSYDKLEIFAGILTGVAIFIIVGVGMIIGIKYLVSSVDKRAELKKALIIYLVGSAVALGALGIWKFFINTFQNIV